MTNFKMSDLADNLLDLAFVSGFNDGFPALAVMAETEDWSYHHKDSHRPNPVLTNYVQFTYKRLVEEGKIAITDDGQYMCFNTGLVSEKQEEIFALLMPNKNDKAVQKWYLLGWRKRGTPDLAVFSVLPEFASYHDDPRALVYDTSLDLRIDLDQIIGENRGKFPVPFRSMEEFALKTFLTGAIEATKRRVRRNYRTAIPQYYRGRAQLLLPICMNDPKLADVALSVERMNGHYQATACLPLDQAYNNARQFARPDRDWLRP